jgi:hypothetical protein
MRVSLLLGLLVLTGCSKAPPSPEEPGPVKETPSAGDTPAIREWLKKSRQELASLEQEEGESLALEEKEVRTSPNLHPFLGDVRFPSITPVWDSAVYSKADGFSLPPYLRSGQKEDALAWHLARFGDLEAALKLAHPEEAERLTSLHHTLYDRNYPLEWSRAVARTIHLAQARLLRGTRESAQDIITVHRQIREVFSKREQQSPLAASLLPLGRRALTLAQKVRPELFTQIPEALSHWGDVPRPTPVLTPGASIGLLAQLWGSSPRDGLLIPDDLSRALDTLGLPIPRTGVQSVVALCDEGKTLREVLVTYRPELVLTYRSVSDMAHVLEEAGLAGQVSQEKGGVLFASFSLGGSALDAYLCRTNGKVGALLRLHAEPRVSVPVALARDFGVVHLDASFEENRRQIAPGQLGDELVISDRESLARLRSPLGNLPLRAARIRRAAGSSGTQSLVLTVDGTTVSLNQVASPLRRHLGVGTISARDDDQGGYLRFSWSDTRTDYHLDVPNAGSLPYRFEAISQRAGRSAPEAGSFDLGRRQERLAAGKPQTVLPRSLVLTNLLLGMSRAEVQKNLPRTENTPAGLRFVFPPTNLPREGFLPRQLLVRFDAAGRAAEVRLLLSEGEDRARREDLLQRLLQKYGRTAPAPSPWNALWGDGAGARATFHRWVDDLTIMTFESRGTSAEWVLRDRPLEYPQGVPLPPLAFCPRGLEGCHLGDTREAILKNWKGTLSHQEADPLGLAPEKDNLFDGVYVWFKDGRVSQILARHAGTKEGRLQTAELIRELERAWGRILPAVGCWSFRHADVRNFPSLFWADERTGLRIFWAYDRGKPRLFTEWRAMPGEPSSAPGN